MASKDDGGVQETSLDEVEVDEEGNVVYPSSSINEIHIIDKDEEEVDTDALEVDEDGNLRIQSASRLLGELDGAKDQGAQRRESYKRNRKEHGTIEEETEMMAMDSLRDAETNERCLSGSFPPAREEDHQAIELTVLERPTLAQAEDSYQPAGSVHSLEMGDRRPDRPKKKGLGRVLDLIGCQLSSASPERVAIIAAAVIIIIGILLTVSLVPASFVYVEYYELALAKNRVSGKVNREDVYYPGCYLLTPDVELVRFQGTAHLVEQTLQVVTSDRLMFNLEISLQYFIKPKELGLLFTDYTHNYAPVVEAMIESTIHTAAVNFSLDHFRLNRSHVEQTLRQAVALKLSGNCCPGCCPFDCSKAVNCRACRLEGWGCDRGIHMELRYFQMGAVDIADEVSERFLRQTILLIEAEKELFVQEHALETKKSEQMQKDILNKAAEIREAAVAEAKRIHSDAEADFEKKVQTSYAAALKKFYQRLNITREEHKLSLMYIRTLEDISDNLYNLNYDTLTTFN